MNMPRSPIRLGPDALSLLPAQVRTPAYHRGALKHHTVHIGVGGFHRAHQAVYLDDLLSLPDMARWGECGIGVLPSDLPMRDALRGQDCLYTVVERSASARTARVIGSMTEYIYAPENREAAIEKMASPDTRIVSLTITEGGYFLHESTGEFLADHPDIRRDLNDPHRASTWLALVSEALHRRHQRGLPPFTVMSCDNLQANGDTARKVMLAFTGSVNTELQRWIATHGDFPNSMVDRITPGTTPADIAYIAETFGLKDAWPVVTEPFRQWVIEDAFSNGRPEWQRVGAQFTSDVPSYEMMKIRLLNGGHLAIAYLGALRGFTFVHDAMSDPLILAFLQAFMDEVTPVVPIISGVSLPDYKASLIERFANPTINDQVTRICSEGSAKIPKWLLPTIRDLIQQQRPIRMLSLILASWIRYLAVGSDEQGNPLHIVDAKVDELTALARTAPNDPRPLLSIQALFGEDLPRNPSFVRAIETDLREMQELGTQAVIRQRLPAFRTASPPASR